jgi:HPt (histidine-containing phosphotransfer) domain-containing protein
MDDYISKPIQVPELIAALNRTQVRAGWDRGQGAGVRKQTWTDHPLTSAIQQPTVSDAAVSSNQRLEKRQFPASSNQQPVSKREDTTCGTPLPALDRDVLHRLHESLGRRADQKLSALLASFYESAPRLLTEAQQALDTDDRETLNRAAHTLKSTCAIMGATALSEMARSLEFDTKIEIPPDATERVKRLAAAYTEAKSALETAHAEMTQNKKS